MADDDLAAAAATGLHILEGSIRPIKLSVASNEEIVSSSSFLLFVSMDQLSRSPWLIDLL
jgi:hypothetical protein